MAAYQEAGHMNQEIVVHKIVNLSYMICMYDKCNQIARTGRQHGFCNTDNN